MFMRSRLSVEDEGSRDKDGFPGIEEHSLRKFSGPGAEQWGPCPWPWHYSKTWQELRMGSPWCLARQPCQSFMGASFVGRSRTRRASEPELAELSVIIRADQCPISKEVSALP